MQISKMELGEEHIVEELKGDMVRDVRRYSEHRTDYIYAQ